MLGKFLYHGGAIVSAFSFGCVLLSLADIRMLITFLVCFLGGLLAHTVGVLLLNKELNDENL